MDNFELTLRVRTAEGNGDRDTQVLVTRAFNFGYAGRSRADAEKHVEELRELGLPAPTRIPSIFPIPPARVTTSDRLCLPGLDNYGEVEFALIHTADFGWCVAAASDHSDFLVESISTTRAKTVYQDVVSKECWQLSVVSDHWDQLTLTCERLVEGGWETTQSGTVGELLSPQDLIAELELRSGIAAEPGVVILSGTIGGEILPGANAWRARLSDPVLQRELVAQYATDSLPAEI